MLKKSLAVGIIFFLVISSVPYSILSDEISTGTFDGNTLYVGGTGPGNYSRIQDAVDNASDGDTVFVYGGVYYENVVIDKSIILQGENRDSTFIDGGGNDYVFTVSADWIEIYNFTIQNSKMGIYLISSSNNIISGNNIASNRKYGIYSSHSSYNTFSGNNINNNNYYGITLSSSSNNIISGNSISNHGFDGIKLWNSSHNTFSGNNINNNNDAGITLWFSGTNKNLGSNNNTVSNNNINNNDDGIHLWCSLNNTVSYNNISNNYCGITLWESSHNTFSCNIINNSKSWGIYLMRSLNNTISCNNISNNKRGILIEGSSNSIIGNDIKDNKEYGIKEYGSYQDNESNNLFYYNHFINNVINAISTCTSQWDNGAVGNYWGDYKEKYPYAHRKILRPWIWNKPYDISDGDNKDCFPLSINIFALSDLFQRIFNFDWHPAKEPYDITAGGA